MKKFMFYLVICICLLNCGGDSPNSDFKDTTDSITLSNEEINEEVLIENKGTVTIKLKLSSPNSNITKVNISITKEAFTENKDYTVTNNEVTGSFLDLLPGLYIIDIKGYNNEQIVATGTGETTIIAGETTNTSIALTLLTGTLDINVELPNIVPLNTNIGTFENPYPVNNFQTMPDGWVIKINSFDTDAWPEIQEENMFNDPPANDKRMVMVNISVINKTMDSPNFIWEFDFYMGGSLNIEYSTFSGDTCGVTPDYLDENLYLNGESSGNVCFQVGIFEDNFKLAYQYEYDSYIYFNVE